MTGLSNPKALCYSCLASTKVQIYIMQEGDSVGGREEEGESWVGKNDR